MLGRIAAAAARAGRDPGSIELLAVTKTVAVPDVLAAIEAGVAAVGENRVQEAQAKFQSLPPGVSRHLIGRLQSNKVRDAAALFEVVQSVDRPDLATALNRAAEARGRPLRVLVQLNVAGAAGQGGLPAREADDFIDFCMNFPYLRMGGVMAIGAHGAPEPVLREGFRAAREIFRAAAARVGPECRTLSLGMSGDFEIAVEEGSTLVRIGTAIFGQRRRL